MIRIFKLLKLQCGEFPVLVVFLITCACWMSGRAPFVSLKSINIWLLIPVQWIYFRPLLLFGLQDRIGFFVHPLSGYERLGSMLGSYSLFLITMLVEAVALDNWMFFMVSLFVALGDIMNRILSLLFLNRGSTNYLFYFEKKRSNIMTHND